MTTFVLAGGCFWCLDAVYRALDGVTEVVSGYTGGSSPDPTYDEVVTGTTGHAECVRVTFDPAVLPADVVLDVFYTVHDPRQLDRQGADVGSQYRSATFAADDAQREVLERARERADATWGGGVVTTVDTLGRFWPAEEEHQDFAEKNPGQGYCVAVARPKVIAVRRAYARYALAT
jgi:peptide-methionine (S)-S-oxide reductase